MAALIARLLRSPTTDQGTFGRLQFGGRSLFTTELPWRNNRQQRSCIPAGVYQVALVNSPRFGRVYGVANVPGRSHVLIHAANLGGDIDMGWQTQLQGCIAPAVRLGAMQIPATATQPSRMQAAGLVSRPALTEFMAWANGNPFTLEITES